MGKLTVKQLAKLPPGLHADGDNLYLQANGKGGGSWIFRYWNGARSRNVDLGLGSLSVVSLSEARELAHGMRKLNAALKNDGVDLKEHLEAQRRITKEDRAAQVASPQKVTFAAYVDDYIITHKTAWKNANHRQQWQNTIDQYVKPVFENTPVSDITTELVMKVLRPIWHEKPETASRIRGRIEMVLDAAKTEGLRSGENPARWKGHIAHLLPSTRKIRPVRNHPALPYPQIAKFMAALRERPGLSARALEFCILTATRAGETAGAHWEKEIDLDNQIWTIAENRMKAGREHRVPLEGRALEILLSFPPGERSGPVFPGIGRRAGASMSPAALDRILELMGDWRDRKGEPITVHGFRSSFRDWTAECTSFDREVAEMALAHSVGDETEQAYRRADLLDKRRRLMRTWTQYCAGEPITDAATSLIEQMAKRLEDLDLENQKLRKLIAEYAPASRR